MTGCPRALSVGWSLAPHRAERLRRHLEDCARCRAERQTDAIVGTLVRELPIVDPARNRLTAIRTALLAEVPPARARWPRWVRTGLSTLARLGRR